MKPTKQRQGGPLVSMCYSAGTGSSVLDPFPSVVVASLRAVELHAPAEERVGKGSETLVTEVDTL